MLGTNKLYQMTCNSRFELNANLKSCLFLVYLSVRIYLKLFSAAGVASLFLNLSKDVTAGTVGTLSLPVRDGLTLGLVNLVGCGSANLVGG